MITYHPSFDLSHCIFRILVLLDKLNGAPIEAEKLRILDFYFLFPKEISLIKVSPLEMGKRKSFSKYPQYESIINPVKTFYRIEDVFNNALRTILNSGMAIEVGTDKLIAINPIKIPNKLREKIKDRENSFSEVLDFLILNLYTYPLHGVGGLKERTKLLTSKYDRK